MPLTQQEKQKLWEILDETGGHKEVMLCQREIPEEYKGLKEECIREERELSFPNLAPVRVILTRAKKMEPEAPLHINFHGGGFVFKQNEDDDLYCTHLAAQCGGMVVDVDYATSQEHPYPMALDQCWQVALWAYSYAIQWGCSEKRISVGGSSAGGNLAMGVAMRAKETGKLPLCLMVLEYAATDNAMCMEDPGQIRSQAFSRFYVDNKLELLTDSYVSPFYASDEQLQGLPPTLIIAPVKCPFYHANNQLGMRMVENGVRVTFQAYPHSTHGFTVRMMGDWQDSQKLVIQEIQQASL